MLSGQTIHEVANACRAGTISTRGPANLKCLVNEPCITVIEAAFPKIKCQIQVTDHCLPGSSEPLNLEHALIIFLSIEDFSEFPTFNLHECKIDLKSGFALN